MIKSTLTPRGDRITITFSSKDLHQVLGPVMDWDRKTCSKVFRKIHKEFYGLCDKLYHSGLEDLVYLANQTTESQR